MKNLFELNFTTIQRCVRRLKLMLFHKSHSHFRFCRRLNKMPKIMVSFTKNEFKICFICHLFAMHTYNIGTFYLMSNFSSNYWFHLPLPHETAKQILFLYMYNSRMKLNFETSFRR